MLAGAEDAEGHERRVDGDQQQRGQGGFVRIVVAIDQGLVVGEFMVRVDAQGAMLHHGGHHGGTAHGVGVEAAVQMPAAEQQGAEEEQHNAPTAQRFRVGSALVDRYGHGRFKLPIGAKVGDRPGNLERLSTSPCGIRGSA
ncbi:MAG: hypothetical protein IPI41_16400 [Flavobacteriales bacterium]|nr:hypothetical protein [Flavobacteriales bacterium]